ncbi:MAG: HAMP domain-containing sensor histidine kinase [Myxococcota bacterium]
MRASLRLRVSLALVALVSLLLTILGGAGFMLILEVEDRVIQQTAARALFCRAHSAEQAFIACLTSATGPPAGRDVAVDNAAGEALRDTQTGQVVATEALDILDPVEWLLGLTGVLVIAAAALATLVISLSLTRVVLRPIDDLQAIVASAEPAALGQTLAARRLPEEVEGLRLRLVASLGRVEASRRREALFSRYVSHELRTPLAVCRSAAELIAADGDLSRRQERAVARLYRASQEMQLTIDTLLALARQVAVGPQATPVAPARVVDELAPALRAEATRRGVAFAIEDTSTAEAAPVDPVSLKIIVRNLVFNALRHARGGSVTLHSSDRHVAVRDSGPGIPDDKIARLLRPFESEAPDGFGLGLSLVVDICGNRGWTFRIHNRAEGGLDASIEFAAERSDRPGLDLTVTST